MTELNTSTGVNSNVEMNSVPKPNDLIVNAAVALNSILRKNNSRRG